MSEMKTCTDCKHFAGVIFLDTHNYDPDDFPTMTETYRRNVCEALVIRNPVNGQRRILSAADMRQSGGRCGPKAKLFKANR